MKKIAGMNPKVAAAVFAGVFILVYLWYRNRSQNVGIPTQTQTTPQVGPQQSTAAPAATGDSTGGVTQSPSVGDLLSTLSGFLGSLPYTSYTYSPTTTTTTTTTGSYNTYLTGGSDSNTPPTPPQGPPPPPPARPTVPDYTPDYQPNTVYTAPASSGGGTFVHDPHGIGGHL